MNCCSFHPFRHWRHCDSDIHRHPVISSCWFVNRSYNLTLPFSMKFNPETASTHSLAISRTLFTAIVRFFGCLTNPSRLVNLERAVWSPISQFSTLFNLLARLCVSYSPIPKIHLCLIEQPLCNQLFLLLALLRRTFYALYVYCLICIHLRSCLRRSAHKVCYFTVHLKPSSMYIHVFVSFFLAYYYWFVCLKFITA